MAEIILNSGTTWTVPNDWNDNDNSIECWGAGASGTGHSGSKQTDGHPGGGAGAYCRGDNIALTPNATVQVRIGAGPSGTSSAGTAGGHTSFNATDLANAVSNGDAISVAAPGGSPGSGTGSGGTGGPGGIGTNGVGNHTRTSGGPGGNGSQNSSSGAGGNSPNGGMGGASVSSAASHGITGGAPGGGGSGARGNGVRNGGGGANGRIRITYTPLPPGRHRMFLVFSNAAAVLLSGWTALIGAVASLVAKQPRAGGEHKRKGGAIGMALR